MYAKFLKIEFCLAFVVFLGYVVSKESITMDPQKVKATVDWPRLMSAMEVQSFLGMMGYYKKFINGFLYIAIPLTKFTQKAMLFVYTLECEASFQNLKECLESSHITLLSRTEGFQV